MKYLNTICDFFLASAELKDAEEERRGRLLVACTVPLLGILVVALAVGVGVQASPLDLAAVAGMTLLVIGELIALRLSGKVRLICWVHVVVLHLIALVAIDIPNSSSEAAVLYAATIPTISVFLLGRKGVLSFISASIMVGGLVVTELEPLIQAIVSMGVITAICLVFELSRETSMALANEKNVELSEALVQAQAAARAKDQFLATISHEIRTPMNGVLGMNRLLMDTELDEDQNELARTALDSGEALLLLVNDVLDFARLQAERVSLDQSPFKVAPLLSELESRHRPVAQEKGLRLTIVTDSTVPTWVSGDRGRVQQILDQLLENATKFTPKGSVVVRVLGCEDGLSVEVEDSGIGISEACQAVIFDAFSQVDGSATRRFGGTGLGLAISEHLSRQMGGRITLRSTLGKGSVFRLFLPSIACSGPSVQVEDSPLPEGVLRILVVEDNPINQMLARRLLERMGHEVEVAADGAIGVERVRTGHFDLVLMDCQMPVMDGYAATAGIRALPEKAGVAIIALTANAMQGDRERCLEAGMDDYLAKPVSPGQLEEVIRRWQPGRQAA